MLTCTVCSTEFERPGTRGPRPKYCSLKCKGKKDRERPGRKAYEREYRRAYRAAGRAAAYEYEYNRRPENKKKQVERYYALYRDPFMDVAIPAPYSGHKWFDMVRGVVGKIPPAQDAPWADQWNDEMGEAVLAFLEGRDPMEGLTKARKDYNMMKYRQVYISQLETKDEDDNVEWDRYIPQPVPEPAPIVYEVAPRVDWTTNKVRGLHAGKRKGSRGPNKSHRKFRKEEYE